MPETIQPRAITDEVRESYLDYAMSVIVSRALPDVRDGLKPVHRRILFAMHEMGLRPQARFRKSAAIVGSVLGQYHPHGDLSVYEAMVRMAQPWSLRYLLVEGQGNFGCFTGDTKIKLLDGTEQSFAELAKLPPDQVFSVYSVDDEGNIVVGEGRHARVTRRNAELIELTLDTGVKVRCTPDHRFLLRDGTYKQAKNLEPTDSLFPGYFDTARVKEGLKSEYLRVWQSRANAWSFVHHLADMFNARRGRARTFHGPFVRHHKNFNRFDNRPDNIERLGFREHLQLHAVQVGSLWKDPEFRRRQRSAVERFYALHPEARQRAAERLREHNRDPVFRQKNARRQSSLMKNLAVDPVWRRKVSDGQRALWADPAYRAKMSAALRGIIKKPLTEDQKRRVAQMIRKHNYRMWRDPVKRAEIVSALQQAMRDPVRRAQQRERSRRLWEDPDFRAMFSREHFVRAAKKLWAVPEIRGRFREKARRQWENPEFRQKVIAAVSRSNVRRLREQPQMMVEMAGRSARVLQRNWRRPAYRARVMRSRIGGYVSGLVRRHGVRAVTPALYEASRPQNCIPHVTKALAYYGGNFEAMVSVASRRNHRIVAKRMLTERADVYDITVDEHHNFLLADGVFVHNSIDGDSPAAMRYSEAKLGRIGDTLLHDLEKETVSFVDNYDRTRREPAVLPSAFPNMLVNGTVGIAVGMATSMPPHNLGEVVDALTHLAKHPRTTVEDLLEHIHGPDFPTGGIVYGARDIAAAYATGKGPMVTRAKAEIVEEKDGAFRIIVTEIPFQVNKSALLEEIAEGVRTKRLEGMKDLRDESDKDGIRVVIELKRDAVPRKVLNQLFAHTALQRTFHVNLLALVDGIQPRILTLKGLLEQFLEHRRVVVTRRSTFDLKRARERAHVLEGLTKALDHIDAVIATIKRSATREDAQKNLVAKFTLSDVQATAILEMRLQTLAGLERKKIDDELKEKRRLIKELQALLKDPQQITKVVLEALARLKEQFGDARRTEVVARPVAEFSAEDLVPDEDTVITVTSGGYVKRLPIAAYRVQRRGGKGVIGITTKEEDTVDTLLVTRTHADILFFTNQGRVFAAKAYDLPLTSRAAKGQALQNFLSLGSGEKVTAVLALPKGVVQAKNAKRKASNGAEAPGFLVMVTRAGTVKRVPLSELANVRRSGLIAIRLRHGDTLDWVAWSHGSDHVMLVTAKGQSIRFKETDVRPMGRPAAGVTGMRLKRGDAIIGMTLIRSDVKGGDAHILVLTEQGYGKRTLLSAYKVQRRGGQGVKTAAVTSKTGPVVGMALTPTAVDADATVIVTSAKGQVIRVPVIGISVLGRATQGVRVMRMDAGDAVASFTTFSGAVSP